MPSEIEISGWEGELRVLVDNLIDNALRHAPSGSAVTVSAAPEADGIGLRVADSGPGIPAAERDRVFARFHRVEGDATHGTGLGLAIAKSIVEHHSGRIELEQTRPGDALPGLTVHMHFPVARARFPANPGGSSRAH